MKFSYSEYNKVNFTQKYFQYTPDSSPIRLIYVVFQDGQLYKFSNCGYNMMIFFQKL